MTTNKNTSNAVTRFFAEVVGELAHSLSHLDGGDETVWELSRRLHGLWREALRKSRSSGRQRPPAMDGHPAFAELKRLVDLEVEE